MLARRTLTVVGMVTVLLGMPRTTSAGIIDVIWEMSGPQLLGGSFECRLGLNGAVGPCGIAGFQVNAHKPALPVWLSLAEGLYVSTGKNASGQDYEFGKTWMVAFEPMLEVQSFNAGGLQIYHGVMGLSYDFLFGDFSSFSNVGFKLRPVAFMIRDRIVIAYNLRLYPRGFTADQFGKVLLAPADTKPETVHGFTIGYFWGK